MCRRVLPLLLCVAKGAPLLLCVRRVLSLLLQVPQNQPNYFPSIDGTQDSMYIPVPQDEPYYFPCMDGTHDSMYVSAGVSTIQMADNIRSTSHTRSGMVNNISSQSSTVVSKFVDLNINADSNAPFFFVF
ncbi:uncharacterized protein LOC114257030 isoform X1 [Camellia sinensis]|uniref:uncharacterized protein LOC114257030 isoform X1 n=1 Tax=Camellia sinensis TaxID=4442 RepID=UPI0010358E2D|nr:uncharacterized protein LOC114257030 isoform X1 [Camellia sinensis]